MLYIEPSAGIAPVLQVIRSARHQVNLNGYLVDDGPILRALAAAHARGVDVRVMIEGKPYGMKPWQVQNEARRIAATGAAVKYAPNRFESQGSHWRFDHGKWTCSLHECEIGSPNYTYAGFGHDRDYLVDTQNSEVVRAANAVFNAEWNKQYVPTRAHQVLVLSPGTSARQLLQVIGQPGTIDVESEELGPYRPILDALAAKGKDLRLILPASINREDQRDVNFLRQHGCQVRLLPKKPLYMHAKMIVGSRLAFIGSENFTQTSLEDNREMGILLNGGDIAKLQTQFNRDWKRAGSGMSGLAAKATGWLSRF